MKLLDVTGEGQHYVNLDLVRYIRIKSFEGSEISFSYTDRDEDAFGVSPDRLAEIEGILDTLKSLTVCLHTDIVHIIPRGESIPIRKAISDRTGAIKRKGRSSLELGVEHLEAVDDELDRFISKRA